MATARKEVVRDGVRAVYHCTSRCVRRAFLCGVDTYSGKNYEHRRAWFRSRLRALSQLFTIDVLAFAAMGTHHHSVIRTRPELAQTLSDEEVVRRWMRVFPRRREGTREEIRQAIENEVQATLKTSDVQELRNRLCSVSWFMKSLNEYIARRANQEDGVGGRFWEGRFKCQRLEDDAAILTCMVYVDLNPVRAKLAHSLEDSVFTSAYDRIQAASARKSQKTLSEKNKPRRDQPSNNTSKSFVTATVPRASWLVDLGGSEGPIPGLTDRSYLNLVDQTGRRIRQCKRGYISPEVTPILEALEIDTTRWVTSVEHYGSLFCRIVGTAEALKRAASAAGKRWFVGRSGSEALFRQPVLT